MTQRISDLEFITLFEMCNRNPQTMSKSIGMSVRNIQNRRDTLETRYEKEMNTNTLVDLVGTKPDRINLGIENGTVIVFSDAHFWPGIRTTAYNGLIWAIQNLENIKAVINNGDAFDLSLIHI